jgi:PAS domain S-box-containing protein
MAPPKGKSEDELRAELDEARARVADLEARLGESEGRRGAETVLGDTAFRGVLETAPAGIFLMDADGLITFANQRFVEMLGHDSLQDLQGASYMDYVHPSEAEQVRTCIQRVMHGELEHLSVQRVYRRRDNATFYGHLSGRRVLDGEGGFQALLGVVLDLTERKRAEAALKESEERLRTLINATPDIVCFKDGEGRWLEANPADLELFRLQGVDYRGKKDSELAEFSPFYREAFLACEQSDEIAWLAGGVSRGEEVVPVPDGGSRVYDVIKAPLFHESGQRKGLIVIGRDVTERKRAEEKLREEEQRFREAIAMAPYPMGIVDLDGRVLYTNDKLSDIFGYSRESLPTVDDLWRAAYPDPKRRERVRSVWEPAVREAIKSGREMEPQRLRIVARDGEMRDVELRMVPIGDRCLVTMVDLTAQREIEDHLRRAKEEAEAASRSKSEFLANMSHEIRTPLHGLMGMLHLLESTDVTPDQMEFIDKARLSCKRLANLLNDILDLSKVEAGRLELKETAFNLHETLETVSTLFAHAAGRKGLELSVRADSRLPGLLVGDPARLQQILHNLVGNAVKFTPSGEIRVEAHSLGRNRDGRVRVLFEVVDTGEGIPDDLMEHVFESFTQAEGDMTRRHQGAGLGLLIVKRLVQLMGGGVAVESEQGSGTRVLVNLAFGVSDSSPQEIAPGAPAPLLSGRRLLVAEDDEISLQALKMLLERQGGSVRSARNGREVLEAMAAERFDCVFMDVRMPVVNGVEATRSIREMESRGESPRTPVVALSAHAMAGDREAFLKAGMDDYLAKPVDVDDLQRVLAGILEAGADS